MVKLIIPGRAVPYVRTTQKQKWLDKSYKRYQEYKQVIQWYAMRAFKIPTKDKVAVRVTTYLNGGGMYDMGKDGDVDNYLKSALDSLNKIVFDDDRQVMIAITEKISVKTKADERMEITELDQIVIMEKKDIRKIIKLLEIDTCKNSNIDKAIGLLNYMLSER